MTFEDIYNTYYNRVFLYVRQHTDTREDAEDITDSVFVSAYKSFNKYDPERSSEITWLYVITNNLLKNYYRDKKTIYSIDDPDFSEKANEENIDKTVDLTEMRRLLSEALGSLDEDKRKIVILKYFYNKSSREISEATGFSEVNVRVILNRSLEKMKKFFEKSNIKWEF